MYYIQEQIRIFRSVQSHRYPFKNHKEEKIIYN
jgi:hypothetical protein